MRIIIAGGRDFTDYPFLEKEVLGIVKELKSEGYNTNRDNLTLVSGMARGADSLGEKFAIKFKLAVEHFQPDWYTYGKAGGFRRNEEMAKYAKEDSELGVLIAFWDKTSKGTKHMINLAKKYGLRTYVRYY